MILTSAEIIHSVCELSLSRSGAAGRAGQTIKAVRNHIKLCEEITDTDETCVRPPSVACLFIL